MAQTTTAVSGSAVYVAVSTDGSSWTDISGSISKIDPGAIKRKSGTAYTPGVETAIVTYGVVEPIPITLTILYTPTAGEAWARARAAFQAAGGGRMDLRWAPEGNASGKLQYTTPSAKIVELDFPGGDAASANPILLTVKWLVGGVTESTIP